MRLALGLFHFNVQYISGDILSYHRYATQAILPFLHFIAEDSRYHVSFEIAGSGLEFLEQYYPEAIKLLRHLINAGNIELISSTYAPTLWVAFPGLDLRRSVELNRRVLDRLQLVAAPIFFAQEAFSGYGIDIVGDFFSTIIIKDDYLSYYRPDLRGTTAYRSQALKILVGRGHIRASLASIHNGSDLVFGDSNDDQHPLWYHVGSGHHLTTPVHPHAWSHFFADNDWIASSRQFMDRMLDSGMRLGTILEYADSMQAKDLAPFPLIPEGSWNARKSEGVYAWMGRHAHAWETDAELLGVVWRARSIVRTLERTAETTAPAQILLSQDELLTAWQFLIKAEASDPLGWEPLRSEVQSGRVAAEEAFRFAASLQSRLPSQVFPRLAETSVGISGRALERWEPDRECAQLVGARGQLRWRAISDNEQQCDVFLTATASSCGVQFSRSSGPCFYCPTGLEFQPHLIDPSAFDCNAIYLPLANGYISLDHNLHLIRINSFGQVAAELSARSTWLCFLTKGTPIGRRYHWQFILVRGTIEAAVLRANSANNI